MNKKPIITAEEAANLINNDDVFMAAGFVSSGVPEHIYKAIEERFLKTGEPKNLSFYFVSSQGDKEGHGAEHLAHEGLLKRTCGAHYAKMPALYKMINENKFEAYNIPQGIMAMLLRDIAAGRVGHITPVGINTFVDPRNGGGKLNEITTEDLVELISIDGKEQLLYKPFYPNIAFVRGTTADENGNVTMEHECCPMDATATAMATKNSGGKVIVQVERVTKSGSLDPKLVKIPGIYVDAIVICDNPKEHEQCFGCEYDPTFTGESRSEMIKSKPIPMSAKKIIGRRGALELRQNTVVNLGIGTPEYVAKVADEEGIGDYVTLTVEAGPIGGVPASGNQFGGSTNPECLLDQAYQFDFYCGGGLDYAFLGLAESDKEGNINVSRFNGVVAGCGGFIEITQNAKRVYFLGTFTAGGLKVHTENGKLVIDQEGSTIKFLEHVEQVTFSGKYATLKKQPVKYITERAVFELREDGVYLTEVAPGIDIKTQILDLMNFEPKMDIGGPSLMDERIFRDELMGL